MGSGSGVGSGVGIDVGSGVGSGVGVVWGVGVMWGVGVVRGVGSGVGICVWVVWCGEWCRDLCVGSDVGIGVCIFLQQPGHKFEMLERCLYFQVNQTTANCWAVLTMHSCLHTLLACLLGKYYVIFMKYSCQ